MRSIKHLVITDCCHRLAPPRFQGGYVLWVELPRSVDALDVHRQALEQKISIARGPIFSAKQRYKNCLRISCGLPWSERIDNAVRALGSLVEKLSAQSRPHRSLKSL